MFFLPAGRDFLRHEKIFVTKGADRFYLPWTQFSPGCGKMGCLGALMQVRLNPRVIQRKWFPTLIYCAQDIVKRRKKDYYGASCEAFVGGCGSSNVVCVSLNRALMNRRQPAPRVCHVCVRVRQCVKVRVRVWVHDGRNGSRREKFIVRIVTV